jgi:phosphoribosylformylglycinamidine synthase I
MVEKNKPRALVIGGYGINCDEETRYAFEVAGANVNWMHVNDLIGSPEKLRDYQIIAFPGGFSYGDDTGSGNALALKIRHGLGIDRLVDGDKLIIGICNGFQVLTNLGLVPALNNSYGERQSALLHNDFPRYHSRWVDLDFSGNSPWIKGLNQMMIPVAHGEGKFYSEPFVLQRLNEKGMIAARYVNGEICQHFNIEPNPNGSLENIAGVTDESGKILGMMPHPERAIGFTHLPHWTFLKEQLKRRGEEVPDEYLGIQIFKNGVEYFK